MAIKVLTATSANILPAHGHLTLLGEDYFSSWKTMPRDLHEGAPLSESPLAPNADAILPGGTLSEASSSGDGMPPPPPATTGAHVSKKRKQTKPKLSTADLRRTTSTPQIRGLAQPDAPPLQSPTSDKRRNKLGYHRTSVACGHCRRRKIRCLLSQDDSRCLNCIRLKKDCHFYPVDQGPAEVKGRPAGTVDKSSKQLTHSDHSSPRTSGASDSIDDATKVQGLPMQEPFSVHSSKQSSELDFTGSPLDGGPFQSPTFSYQGMPDSSHWGSASFFGSQQLSEESTPLSTTEFWSRQHQPGSTVYQHRGSIPIGLDQSAAFFMPQSEPGTGWSAMRSMSVGDASQMSHLQQFQQTYRQTYPASAYSFHGADGSSASFPTASTEHEHPIASPAPHILPSQTFPQVWPSFTQSEQPGPAMDQPQGMFGAHWYSEPGTMGSVDETMPVTTDGTVFTATQPG